MKNIFNNREKGVGAVSVIVIVALLIIVGLLASKNMGGSDEQANKDLVLKFEDLAFEKKDANAAAQLLSDDFKQHNPQIPDGKEGFIQGVGGYLLKQNPNLKLTVKRVVAQDDLVVLHVFGKYDNNNPAERGVAVMDIFRVKDGKIAEHWDVIEAIPETAANTNTMF